MELRLGVFRESEQWLATMRVTWQMLTMAAKGGGGWRRDCRGKRGVIAAPEATEASWIWMTNMHGVKGCCKQEDGSVFWWQVQLLNSYTSNEMLLLLHINKKNKYQPNRMSWWCPQVSLLSWCWALPLRMFWIPWELLSPRGQIQKDLWRR